MEPFCCFFLSDISGIAVDELVELSLEIIDPNSVADSQRQGCVEWITDLK